MTNSNNCDSNAESLTMFTEASLKFNKVLDCTGLLSVNQHGIHTDGRGVRGVQIFTRQTLIALSLSRILPKPDSKNEQFLDVCSVASLSRNLIEGFLSLHFFGLEKISELEADLRYQMMRTHKLREWFHVRKLTDPGDVELLEMEKNLKELEGIIEKHAYLSCLNSFHKRRVLKGIEMYKTKSDFERELQVCSGLPRDYRLLSNLLHALPLAFDRIDNENGRGIMNSTDLFYVVVCLELSSKYLAASTVGIADYLSGSLNEDLKDSVNSIRQYAKS